MIVLFLLGMMFCDHGHTYVAVSVWTICGICSLAYLHMVCHGKTLTQRVKALEVENEALSKAIKRALESHKE